MLTYLLFAIAAVFLTGTAVLVHGLVTSVEGYQDALGFHEGRDPKSRASGGHAKKSGPSRARASAKRRAPKSRELEFAS
jgi:hypothetical protein